MIKLLLLIFCCSSFVGLDFVFAKSSVEVAFLEMYTPNGQLWRPEPHSRWAHVAIKYQDLWLNAAPRKGVHLSTWQELNAIGTVKVVLKIENKTINQKMVTEFLNKDFDYYYSWTDEAIYCSELIAKILDIQPTPMYFDPQVWPPFYQQLNGQPGLSPDGLYRQLVRLQQL